MKPFTAGTVLMLTIGLSSAARLSAQDSSALSGRWTLDRGSSQFPREVGFNMPWMAGASGPETGNNDGRGRQGSGGAGGGLRRTLPESQDDAKRLRQLTDEVRNPPAIITIAETPAMVTITNDRAAPRTFRPDGREAVVDLDGVPVVVTARREAGRLVVLYQVQQARQLRYTYSRQQSPPQLVVDVEFVERGGGDRVHRVYVPAGASETAAAPPPPPPSSVTKPALKASDADTPVVPAAGNRPAQTFNQQPDAELKGLTKLGLVVEDLNAQSASCGLNQATLETALSKRLTDGGFRVQRNSDEDTYVYVNIITATVSNGLCVSRYDAFLYTHTTATLSYQDKPVLVEVSLLHKGGIAGGSSVTHAEGVQRALLEYVDGFVSRIHGANK
jgi:hypothetical protein